jgi:hypothetical protein
MISLFGILNLFLAIPLNCFYIHSTSTNRLQYCSHVCSLTRMRTQMLSEACLTLMDENSELTTCLLDAIPNFLLPSHLVQPLVSHVLDRLEYVSNLVHSRLL